MSELRLIGAYFLIAFLLATNPAHSEILPSEHSWMTEYDIEWSCISIDEGDRWVNWSQHGRYTLFVRNRTETTHENDGNRKFDWLLADKGSKCSLLLTGDFKIQLFDGRSEGKIDYISVDNFQYLGLSNDHEYKKIISSLVEECEASVASFDSWPFQWGLDCRSQVASLLLTDSIKVEVIGRQDNKASEIFVVMNRYYHMGRRYD